MHFELIEDRSGNLPHRNDDAILRLYMHYFDFADLMLENFKKLNKQSASRGLSQAKFIERQHYLIHWLSGLYVTIEGIEVMPMLTELDSRPFDVNILKHRLVQTLDSVDDYRSFLRILRNGSFHYQKTATKISQFFMKTHRLSWALSIHESLRKIFLEYYLSCNVCYAILGRTDEVQIKRKPFKNRSYVYPQFG